MVERRRERHGAKNADAPEGRLQADSPAKGGRHADRSAGVGADGSCAQARGNRRGGACARSAGNPIERPGIMHRAVVRVGAGDSVSEFVQVRFAEQDGAGAGKLSRDGGISGRNEIAQDFRSGGGADAARPDVVLERDRDSEERRNFRAGNCAGGAVAFPRGAPRRAPVSAVTVRNAFSAGFCRSMRRKNSSVSSTGEILRFASSAASSSMVANASDSSFFMVRTVSPAAADFQTFRCWQCSAKREIDFPCGSRRAKGAGIQAKFRSTIRYSLLRRIGSAGYSASTS